MMMLVQYRVNDYTQEAKAFTISEWQLIAQQIGLDAFDRILREHVRNSKWFPSVAELRERAGMTEDTTEALEANLAWEFVQHYSHKHWHPDLGHYSNAPTIPSRTSYALRQIGGLQVIFNCRLEHLTFVKKDFIAAYKLAAKADATMQLAGGNGKLRGYLE
jgi:hypothetical protein